MTMQITARNIFAKHARITIQEAARIVENLPSDFLTELCAAEPQQARHAVHKTYSKYAQALGDAMKRTEARAVTEELSDDREESPVAETGSEPADSGDIAGPDEAPEDTSDINPGLGD